MLVTEYAKFNLTELTWSLDFRPLKDSSWYKPDDFLMVVPAAPIQNTFHGPALAPS